jgi:hypothetical protein
MNIAQIEAIQREISETQENLNRAEAQKKANPKHRYGNGESVDEVIAGYRKQLAALKGEKQ